MTTSESTGPTFLLICDDAGDCTARYCFERGRYWAIWKRPITNTKPLKIKRAVCRTHRDAVEGKPWDEVSEDFRTFTE
jgi:hypothetical protein